MSNTVLYFLAQNLMYGALDATFLFSSYLKNNFFGIISNHKRFTIISHQHIFMCNLEDPAQI